MHPLMHAERSAARHGGRADDYLPLHRLLDSSKAAWPAVQHRFALHSVDLGTAVVTSIFGPHIIAAGRSVPTALLVAEHVTEDLGHAATLADWAATLVPPAFSRVRVRRPWQARFRQAPAEACARTWDGRPEDYVPLIRWLGLPETLAPGEPVAPLALQNASGIFLAELAFGVALATAAGPVPTRPVAERLVEAEWGFIPTLQDVLADTPLNRWRPEPADTLPAGRLDEGAAE